MKKIKNIDLLFKLILVITTFIYILISTIRALNYNIGDSAPRYVPFLVYGVVFYLPVIVIITVIYILVRKKILKDA